MSDFSFQQIAVESDHKKLIGPPTNWLWGTIAIACISLAFFFISNAIGYVIAIVASIVGALAVYQDQQRRSNPNYVSYSWFTPVTQISRYAITLIALGHIVLLAIESAR